MLLEEKNTIVVFMKIFWTLVIQHFTKIAVLKIYSRIFFQPPFCSFRAGYQISFTHTTTHTPVDLYAKICEFQLDYWKANFSENICT